jgi:hypothetical protein
MNVIQPMIQGIPTPITDTIPQLVCFSCGEPVTIEELLLVDQLIEDSPCFKDISESFAHCTGDESLFHENIVNCDATCYAAIVQTIAPCEESTRLGEIANISRALRSLGEESDLARVLGIPATTIITLERLLENLIAVGATPDIMHAELVEALYCKTSVRRS